MIVTMFSGITTNVKAANIISVSDYSSLTTAISSAAEGDTINITSDITVTSEIVIRNKALTIQGNNNIIAVPRPGLDDWGIYNTNPSSFRVFNIDAPGKTIEIKNLTIKGGSTGSTDFKGGAGILNQ
jgi:hypothetical protein